MRKVVVSEFLSLDGVMESPERWQPRYVSDDVAKAIQEDILAADAMLLGRVTYEIFASYWPLQTHNEFGVADKLNSQPKYVVSTSMDKAEWDNSVVIRGNAAEEVSKLKQQPGGVIRITGSATLVESLMPADLIDEYRLLIHPLVVGQGKRLFRDGGPARALALVEARTFSSGVLLSIYRAAAK